jgi:uncharacterized protein YuzE
MTMIETWYDQDDDVLGIQLRQKGYWKSVEVSKNVVVDLSRKGEIIGVEILGAKNSFKNDIPLVISKASAKSKR